MLGLSKVEDVPLRSLDSSRGTVSYAYNQFKGNLLTNFLNDLVVLQKNGLEKDKCEIAQKALGCFVNSLTEIPTGGLLTGPIFPIAQKFETKYIEWNSVENSDKNPTKKRRELLINLRNIRQKITNKSRVLQFELANNLDVLILKSGYEALGELISMAPSEFKNLAKAYSKYMKRGGTGF
ncbi:hypothetical protein KJ966_19060 [bacterium]|nr:hypothetical protein [bacterium]